MPQATLGFYSSILSCILVTATHLKIGHPWISSTGARSSNELQWFDLKIRLKYIRLSDVTQFWWYKSHIVYIWYLVNFSAPTQPYPCNPLADWCMVVELCIASCGAKGCMSCFLNLHMFFFRTRDSVLPMPSSKSWLLYVPFVVAAFCHTPGISNVIHVKCFIILTVCHL